MTSGMHPAHGFIEARLPDWIRGTGERGGFPPAAGGCVRGFARHVPGGARLVLLAW